MSSSHYFGSAHVILTQVGRRAEQRLLPPNVLLRCPLACPNSAPWCLICMMTFAPPSLCLCSSFSVRFHNRGENDRGVLSTTLTSSGKLFFPLLLFLFTFCFQCLNANFVPPLLFTHFLILLFCLPNFCVSEVTGMSEFRGSSASLAFSQWLISSYLDQWDKWMVCVCVRASLCTHVCVQGGRIIEKRENRKI